MNAIKKAAVSTAKFVEAHKVAIAVTITIAMCLKVNKLALRDHENFMEANGLLDAFYAQVD